MSSKFFIYAVLVTVVTTWSSWAKMIGSASNSHSGSGSGSSWSSHSYGGGSYGGGSGGSGHK